MRWSFHFDSGLDSTSDRFSLLKQGRGSHFSLLPVMSAHRLKYEHHPVPLDSRADLFRRDPVPGAQHKTDVKVTCFCLRTSQRSINIVMEVKPKNLEGGNEETEWI